MLSAKQAGTKSSRVEVSRGGENSTFLLPSTGRAALASRLKCGALHPESPKLRIHITGAAGSGTSKPGKALAAQLGARFQEGDGLFWRPSDPPCQAVRPLEQRRALLLAQLQRSPQLVLSGSVNAWGAAVEDAFDSIIFLYVDTALRLTRLGERELRLYGKTDPAFLQWAAQYDAGPPEGRSLAGQRAWQAASPDQGFVFAPQSA